MLWKKYLPFIYAFLATVPGVALRFIHPEISPMLVALLTGMAILAASFLLLWACEVAQLDIPQTLALAVVALIAVLPEYAVDMYFTWMAGQDPQSSYAHYAIANMTGANRLLIGVGWSAIVLLYVWNYHKGVVLEAERRTEILFLLMATAYAVLIPVKGTLEWYDSVVFIAMYVWYIRIASKRPCEEPELEGPAETLAQLPQKQRRMATIGLFLFSALVILADAELFSEGLVASGKVLGVNEFLLVQWLAPIASEAPEFIVAIMFTMRGQASVAMGSLISAKLNQWTLLVGMIPIVFAISSGQITPPLPMDSHQLQEIFLTAAQSIFAVMILCNMNLSMREALMLLILFIGQFASPLYDGFVENLLGLSPDPLRMHDVFIWIYLALSVVMAWIHRRDLWALREGLHVEAKA